LTRFLSWHSNSFGSSYILGSWLFISLYSRWLDWCCSSQFRIRHFFARYLLCRGSLPLCALDRSCVLNHWRSYFLIPFINRSFTSSSINQLSIFSHVCWCKYHLLPSTLLRPTGHAASLFRLSRYFPEIQYNFLFRFSNFYYWCILFVNNYLGQAS